MNLKDVKDRLADAIETDNPPGTDYYGAELDEADVEAARERIEKSTEQHEKAVHDNGDHSVPAPE